MKRWLAAAALLLALVPGPLRGQDLIGTSRIDYFRSTTRQPTLEQEATTIGQNIYLNLSQEVSPVMGYRLDMRSLADESRQRTNGSLTSSSRLSLEPSVEAFLRDPLYDLILGYRYKQDLLKETGEDRRRLTRLDGYSRFFYRPEGLPSFSLQLDRDSSFDNLDRTDTTDTRIFLSSDYRYKFLNFSYNFTGFFSQDKIGRVDRDSFQHLARAGFNRSFFGDRLNANASLLVNQSQQETDRVVGSKSTSTREWSGSVNLSARPFEKAGLNYSFFRTAITRRPEDTKQILTSQGVSFTYDFKENLTGTASYHRSSTDTDVPDTLSTSSDSISLSALHRPLETLSTAYSFSRAIQRQAGEKVSVSDSALASFSGQIYRDLRSTLDISFQKSENFQTDIETLTALVRGLATARLTRNLSSSLTYSFRWQWLQGPAGSSREFGNDESINIVYQASPSLNLRGDFEFTHIEAGNTYFFGLGVDWIPFPALSLFLDLRQEIDVQGRSTSNILSQARWDIGRNIFLRLGHNMRFAPGGLRVREVSALLEFRF